jgi:hypothetical protein
MLRSRTGRCAVLTLLAVSGCVALKDANAYPDGGAAVVDLGMTDAPMFDAPIVDAPMTDAPTIDVPMIDVDSSVETDMGPRCPADPATRPDERVPVDTEYTADTTWDCSKNWVLDGNVVVSAGTLTIEAGTRVRVADRGFILIGQGARLEAVGTREAPIVLGPSTRPAARGQWRGLILLGSAPTGFTSTSRVRETVADGRGAFGGSDDAHDCGHLEYVRVEHAGGSASALNDYFLPAAGLTFAGCGRSTLVDYVQVHRGSDGLGLIGGSVPILHAVVTDPNEDGIEWAAGYRGLIQFAIVQTFPGSSGAIKGNREEGEFSGDPESEPAVFNVTLAGALTPPAGSSESVNGFETGYLLQVGTLGWVRNSVVQGFPGYWANVADGETAGRVGTMRVGMSNTMFFERAVAPRGAFPRGDPPEDEDANFDEDAFFRTPSFGNRFPALTRLLRNPYVGPGAVPDFTADATVASGTFAGAPPGWLGVYRTADYYGAIAPATDAIADRSRVDWTLGWTDFPRD